MLIHWGFGVPSIWKKGERCSKVRRAFLSGRTTAERKISQLQKQDPMLPLLPAFSHPEMTDKSSLREMWASPSFLLSLGDAGDLRPVQQGAWLTPEPSRGPACLGPALLSRSAALLWLQTLKAGKTQGTNSPSLHCSSALAAPAKTEGGKIWSPGAPSARPARRVCPLGSVQLQPPGREPGGALST